MTIPSCTMSLEEMLKDMGCDKKTIEEVKSMQADGNDKGILRVLEIHRQKLLDTVHGYEKKISCLDYFVYYLKKDGADKK